MKKAFTIPELLIIMMIVGIISVSMMTIIKPQEKGLPFQYYNAYNTLRTAMENIYLDVQDAQNSSDVSYTDFDKRMPQTPQELCIRLAVNKDDTDSPYGYINTIQYNCDSFREGHPNPTYGTMQDKEQIAFQASNSMYYFISKKHNITIQSSLTNEYHPFDYFIVYVDLNGEKKPNIVINSPIEAKKAPDVVPFVVVTTTGTVIPVGWPPTDKRYMTAKIKIKISEGNYKYITGLTLWEATDKSYNKEYYPEIDLFSALYEWQQYAYEDAVGFGSNRHLWYNMPLDYTHSECKVDNPTKTLPPCSAVVEEKVVGF